MRFAVTITQFTEMIKRDITPNPSMANVAIHDSLGFEINGYSIGGRGFCVASDIQIKTNEVSTWEYFQGAFALAGFEVLGHYELANQYWPNSYIRERVENPWWLVKTQYGLITIGWRKRVISIDWNFGKFKVTDDATTCEDTYVHAWTKAKAIEYLRTLKACAENTNAGDIQT